MVCSSQNKHFVFTEFYRGVVSVITSTPSSPPLNIQMHRDTAREKYHKLSTVWIFSVTTPSCHNEVGFLCNRTPYVSILHISCSNKSCTGMSLYIHKHFLLCYYYLRFSRKNDHTLTKYDCANIYKKKAIFPKMSTTSGLINLLSGHQRRYLWIFGYICVWPLTNNGSSSDGVVFVPCYMSLLFHKRNNISMSETYYMKIISESVHFGYYWLYLLYWSLDITQIYYQQFVQNGICKTIFGSLDARFIFY